MDRIINQSSLSLSALQRAIYILYTILSFVFPCIYIGAQLTAPTCAYSSKEISARAFGKKGAKLTTKGAKIQKVRFADDR